MAQEVECRLRHSLFVAKRWYGGGGIEPADALRHMPAA